MAKNKRKKTWQQRVWIGISIVSILAMVLFTALPFFTASTQSIY